MQTVDDLLAWLPPSAGTIVPGDPADIAAPMCCKQSYQRSRLQSPELKSTLASSRQPTGLLSPPGDWPHDVYANQPSLTNAKQPSLTVPFSLMLTSSTLLHSQGLPLSESSTRLQIMSRPPSRDSYCSSSLSCLGDKNQVLDTLRASLNTTQSSDPGGCETMNLPRSVPDIGTVHTRFCSASGNLLLDQQDAHQQLRMHIEPPLLSSCSNCVCSELSQHTITLRDPHLQATLPCTCVASQAASPGQHVSLPHYPQPLSTQVWLGLDRLGCWQSCTPHCSNWLLAVAQQPLEARFGAMALH